MSAKRLLVSIDWQGMSHPVGVGRLDVHETRGHEHYRFTYDRTWVSRSGSFAVDPELDLVADMPFVSDRLWGCFQDISPDRWGRLVQTRAASIHLNDSDYMMGVSDHMRMGAMRLSQVDAPDTYLATHTDIPKLVHLRILETAVQHMESGKETPADLAILGQGGSSLGGARPKASVEDNGHLWIAKFASQTDTERTPLWEAVMLDRARQAGIRTPDFRVLHADGSRPILLVARFDRLGGARIPFMSAMTLLGRNEDTKEGASYLEIVDAISRESSQAGMDRLELWRRMTFNAMAGNIDDHLRNHGFLRDRQGWRLAPAYDLNPTLQSFERRTHDLAFDNNARPSLDICIGLAEYFGLTSRETDPVLNDLGKSLSNWQEAARRYGLGGEEIRRLAPSFEHEDSRRLITTSEKKHPRGWCR